ncbi:hypothetical protein V4U86_08370 [Mycobacterium sp. AMU20-3851]|uniref:hypothetical protein n=1 Tax=Mycobacterium sp. AMU20-3851 TaxID=3122055 RepID=UPI00375532A3
MRLAAAVRAAVLLVVVPVEPVLLVVVPEVQVEPVLLVVVRVVRVVPELLVVAPEVQVVRVLLVVVRVLLVVVRVLLAVVRAVLARLVVVPVVRARRAPRAWRAPAVRRPASSTTWRQRLPAVPAPVLRSPMLPRMWAVAARPAVAKESAGEPPAAVRVPALPAVA